MKTQGNHSKNREFRLDQSVATLLKCPNHLNTISFLIVWLYMPLWSRSNWQNLFLINFKWFVDLCVMRILLFQLKGILIFHEVGINEQKVCETFKLYVKG